MALTRPAVFATNADQQVTERHFLVRFVIGSTSRMFSDVPTRITDATGQYDSTGRLLNPADIVISERVDLQQCSFEIPTLSLTIDNSIDPGTGLRPSDEWSSFYTNILSGYVEVYAIAGTGVQVTALTDCLKLFKGRVASAPVVTAQAITFEIEGYARAVHQTLPTVLVSDLSPTASSDNDKRLPIAFGEFITEGGNVGIYSADRWGNRVGRVRAVRTKSNRYYLHSSLSNLGEFWVKKKNGTFIRINNPTITADGNRVYCDIGDDITPIDGYVYMHPTGISSTRNDYGSGPDTAKEYFITGGGATQEFDDGANVIADGSLCFDKDGDTFATLSANVHFYQNNGADHDVMEKAQLALSLSSVKDGNGNAFAVTEALLVWKALLKTITGSPTVKYGTVDTSDPWKATEVAFVHSGIGVRDYASDIYDGNQQTLDISAQVSDTDLSGDQIQFLVYISKELSGGADPGSYGQLLDIYEAYVRCKIQFLLEPEDELWYGGFAAETNTTIAARAGNPLASTDTNKFPCFIIEQILRDVLGVATADIDEAAFDALYDSTMTIACALDRTDTQESLAFLQEIGENSTVVYYMNSFGQHTLLPRKPTAPGSVDATIHRDEMISPPEISETSGDNLVNDLNVEYDWDREANKHRKNLTLSDSTSQTRNGVRVNRALTLKYTDTAVVEDSGGNFITCIKWLFHDSRPVVRMSLAGWERVHLEVGDWFSIDSTTNDPILKFRGSSWSGSKFFITAISKRFDGIELEGILVA